jgi:hypothetical protein
VSLAALLSRPCTITTRTAGETVNAYGDLVTEDVTVETVCELQQRQRSEDDVAGEIAQSGWLLILPAGTTVTSGAKVTVDEESFEVVGEPWPVRNPRTGATSHIEAGVERAASTGDLA